MTASAPPAASAKIRIMIVDDSAIVRGLISRALAGDGRMEVVSSAVNGVMALSQVVHAAPQIILLDIEMPEMDGLTALPKLLQAHPNCRVIMVSTLTARNADISLRALQLGASDYITKPSSREDPQAVAAFYREIIEKIVALAPPTTKTAKPAILPSAVAGSAVPARPVIQAFSKMPDHPIKALVIGCSTGGPQALNTLFAALGTKLSHIPIFITQHMPPTFTAILADHISKACGMPAAETKDGEAVAPGRIYVAPGNYHMVPEKSAGGAVIRLNQNPPENFCRPAVDPMLRGLAPIYGRNLLTVILTGMGSDGAQGAKLVDHEGGTVVAQDEASSVVWGMPRAVAEQNICKAVLPLLEIAPYILKACGK